MSISWRSFTGVTLSNNDLTATMPTHTQSTIATGNGVSSGKWYWEVLVQSAGAIVGVTSTTTGGQIWNTVKHRGYFSGAAKWGGTSGTSYGATFGLGDIISVLLDMDTGTIEFWKNGATQGVAFTNVKSLGTVYPFYGNPTGTGVPSTATARFERKAFSYQVPQGYLHYDIKHKILLSSGSKVYSLIKRFSNNLIPVMTSNTTPSGKATTSSIYHVNYSAWKAFDRLDDQYPWASTSKTGWLAYEFSKPVVIAKYAILANSAELTQAPKSWIFEGSSDGVNWTVLDAQNNQVGWQSGLKREFAIINKKSFIQYRINVIDNNGSTLLSIRGFEMYNYEINSDNLATISNQSEQTFIRYGMDLSTGIYMFNGVQSVETKDNVLSSGKTYEHTIDMSKRRVDKITIG
ncbi:MULTISPECIES: SPRY domain-containing protein [Paenibacillus]|uniref:SPRY domain-containing protein n=1 Tax=Paenibacillus TaxID=44249 RepID=UPI002857A1A7|nr:SPRY domain-containing protein [Paenibacillus sp. 2003]MDR6715868.1 hypothetical protein [Paenibacillus sp. 2003]